MTAFQQGEQCGLESPSLGGLIGNPHTEGTQEYIDWSLGFCKGYADNEL